MHVQTKEKYLINIWVLKKICNDNEVGITAATSVILSLKTKNPPKECIGFVLVF